MLNFDNNNEYTYIQLVVFFLSFVVGIKFNNKCAVRRETSILEYFCQNKHLKYSAKKGEIFLSTNITIVILRTDVRFVEEKSPIFCKNSLKFILICVFLHKETFPP